MSNKICRITIISFMNPQYGLTKEDGYDNSDLDNGIQFCNELLEEGFTHEPMDKFNLKEYMEWAEIEKQKS